MFDSAIFEKFTINDVVIPNRLAVAPMTRVSALDDGTIGPLMKDYYTRFASGGFGLIITEGLYTDQLYSQGYKNQPGLATNEQESGWSGIVQSVHANGAKVIAQLMHAGALSQYNNHKSCTAGPSSVQPVGEQMSSYEGHGPFGKPLEMTIGDIDEATQGFVDAALRAQRCGFDGVEIHGANGYLLDQFLTIYMNKRRDSYGGGLENRTVIYRKVIQAVRTAVGPDFIVGVRLSQKKVNDFEYVWPEKASAAEYIFSLAEKSGADYIHTTEPLVNIAAFGDGAPLSALVKRYCGLAVIANGGIVGSAAAARALESDGADIVALGKIALANQDWPKKVLENRSFKEFDAAMLTPKADLSNAKKYFEEARSS